MHIPSRKVTKRNCSIPPGLPIEMHFVRSVKSERGRSSLANDSSSGDLGNKYGNKKGANVDTIHEMILAMAANNISESCPKINRLPVRPLFSMLGKLFSVESE